MSPIASSTQLGVDGLQALWSGIGLRSCIEMVKSGLALYFICLSFVALYLISCHIAKGVRFVHSGLHVFRGDWAQRRTN